ncbi:hypothetical protein L4X32_14595, partial [Phocaeicola vulgatus]|uniref:hypothetical protein n=6 Tax=Bacteroidaceae TaxID=815 RepID=UPI001F47484F
RIHHWKNTGYCFLTDGKRLMTKKGSLDFLFLIYYIESRRRLRRWKNISQTLSLLQNISDRNRQTPYPPIANYKQQQAVQVSFASLMNTLIPLAGQTH